MINETKNTSANESRFDEGCEKSASVAKKIAFISKSYHLVDTTFVDMLICETFHSQMMLNETSFSSVLNHILV